ncbi:MAG TPA: hypothetical protein VKN99_04145 [Polyangia bacterium]|nr:hypothetical protein [Polyangia bacterium]
MRVPGLLLALALGCDRPPEALPADAGTADAPPPHADWVVAIDPSGPAFALSPALLGHYDLSGALFHYDQVPGLVAAMQSVGFAEWRVGLGRWELVTQMFRTLSDGTACDYAAPEAFLAPGTTDLDLLRARDWFIDDGLPVDPVATGNDARYALGYVRSVLDVAATFGAQPFVSIDEMPRALALSRTPDRVDCRWSFRNTVSNLPPADPNLFGAAVVGVVQRVVEGSGGEPGRPVTHWELWNEPEQPEFWDPAFDPTLDRYRAMALTTLNLLAAYRRDSISPAAKSLRFGLGGFAQAATAVSMMQFFDAGPHPPIDFFSFHSYADDPLVTVDAIARVAAARAASAHYRNAELVLSEWGPDFPRGTDVVYAASMEPALLAGTVIALGAAAGLDRAHHTFFWDFYPAPLKTRGLVDHDGQPRPIHRAYELLAGAIGMRGTARLPVAGAADGRLEGGMGALLATRAVNGAVQVLLVNRGPAARSARIDLRGRVASPRRVRTFDDPTQPVRVAAGSEVVTVPPRALVLIEL